MFVFISMTARCSPFVLRATRPDGQQNLRSIQATLPEGMLTPVDTSRNPAARTETASVCVA